MLLTERVTGSESFAATASVTALRLTVVAAAAATAEGLITCVIRPVGLKEWAGAHARGEQGDRCVPV